MKSETDTTIRKDTGKTYDITPTDTLKWLRANLVPMIFASMLLLQFLTWWEIASLRQEYRPPSCGHYTSCAVELVQEDRALLYDIAHK
jgi:hypothetical protein